MRPFVTGYWWQICAGIVAAEVVTFVVKHFVPGFGLS